MDSYSTFQLAEIVKHYLSAEIRGLRILALLGLRFFILSTYGSQRDAEGKKIYVLRGYK